MKSEWGTLVCEMWGTEFQAPRALPWAGEQLLQRGQSQAASGTLSLGSALHSSSARLWACLTSPRALLLMWKGRQAQDAETAEERDISNPPTPRLAQPPHHLQQMFVRLFPETHQQGCTPSSDNLLQSPVIFTILRSFLFVSQLHLSFCSLSTCFVVLLTLHIKNSHFPLHLIYPAAFL